MKRFLSTTAFVVALAMLFILSPAKSLTADTNSATNQPIKVLKVKINPVGAQQSWLDGLELQVQNTSAKPVNYLLLHVDVSGRSLRVPLIFGQAPDAKTRDAQALQPGAKVTLKAAPALCEKMRLELSANASVPSPQDFQSKINVVIFADKSAWRAGQLHYQDPANSLRWIAVEETQYSHARPKSNSSQQCYRTAGFTLLPCCDSNFVASSNFVADPNGHAQPHEAEACCGSGNCCSYTDIAPCP
jgi:hypothetical protein